MGRKENEKGRYLEEAAIVLAREGFRVEKTPEEKVEVWWEDAPLCEILLDGGIAYQSDNISTPEREVAKDRVYKIVSAVAQYTAKNTATTPRPSTRPRCSRPSSPPSNR